MKDGLAFLLGAANPSENAIGRLPTVTESGGDLVLTFNCLPIAARGTATLKVAHSNNLAAWTPTMDVVPDADDAVPDNDVTFVVGAGPVGPPALNSVTATIDSAAAAPASSSAALRRSNRKSKPAHIIPIPRRLPKRRPPFFRLHVRMEAPV